MSTIQPSQAPATSAPVPAAGPAAPPVSPSPVAQTPAPTGDRTTLSPETSEPASPPSPLPNLTNSFGAPPPAAPASAPQRAEEALRNRDFRSQTQIAQELLRRAGRGEEFTPEERTALRNIANGQQINATLQAAIYQKISTPAGPGGVTAFNKTQFGLVASNDPRLPTGGYAATTVGAEQRIQLPNGTTITPYTQHTVRSDQATTGVEDTHGPQRGVRIEQQVGPARVGVDLNNRQSVVTGKLEREIPGTTTRLGGEVSLSVRGNAFARETAQRAIELERRNQSARRLAERTNTPFLPVAAN